MSAEKESVYAVDRATMPSLDGVPSEHIRQVYLTPHPPADEYPEVKEGEWRIREITPPGSEPTYTTTVKFGSKASGTRQEIETDIAPGYFGTRAADIGRFGCGIVVKQRFRLPDKIDVDQFDPDMHKGLWLAEREFESDEDRAMWQPPEWCIPLQRVPSNREIATPLAQSAQDRRSALLEEIALNVRKLQRAHDKVIVTVSGMSGSGKTTAANLLAQFLGGNHIEADHFHIGQTALLEKFGVVNHDLPGTYDYRLAATAAGRLLARETVTLPRYDFVSAERLTTTQVIEPAQESVVVVDGIYAKLTADFLKSQSADVATYNALMNTPLYVCVLRRMLRDAIGQPASDSIERQVSMSGEETLRYMMSCAIPSYLEHAPQPEHFDAIAK